MPSRLIAITFVSIALCGCQEQVVRDKGYRPMTGMGSGDPRQPHTAPMRHSPTPPQQRDKGLLAGMGDLLFGWTKVFDSEPGGQAPPQPARPGSRPMWEDYGGSPQ